MALKIDKELFDEKSYGGFEPTDPEDETFLLDRLGEYPDVLPYDVQKPETPENLDMYDIEQEIQPKTLEEIEQKESGTKDFQPQGSYEENLLQEETGGPIPYEKSGIEQKEHETIPYEKSGKETVSREPIPYEKSGLIEDEESVPFDHSGIERRPTTIDVEREEQPKSIWDIFEQPETFEQVVPETTEAEEIIPEEGSVKPEPIAEEQIEAKESPSQEAETILITSDSIVDTPMEIKVPPISQEELAKVFDEDFRQTIIEDLEKSKKRRETQKKEPEPIITTSEKEELQKELDQLEESPTEQAPEIDIDISALDVAKPSELAAQQLIESGELDQMKKKKKKKTKKEKKPKPKAPSKEEQVPSIVEFEKEQTRIGKEPEKEKRRRKVPVLWLFVAGGVLLLLLVVGGFLAYRNYFQKKPVPKEIAKKPETKKEEPKPKVEQKEQPQPKEQIATEPKTQNEETVAKAEAKPTSVEPKALPPAAPKVETPKVEKTAKEIAKTKTSEQKPKPEIAKVVTEKPTPAKFKLPQEIKIVETPQEEYSIEIFSTSDPEEAGYWLTQLQKKGFNAYQKIHRIRNVDYYKIRIGSYRTIDEAKSVARALGFKNIWIDRIK